MSLPSSSRLSPAESADLHVLQTLWRNPAEAARLVSERFAMAISESALAGIIKRLQDETGPAVSLSGENGSYAIRTRTHEIPVEIGLDANGRIDALFFGPPQPLTGSPAETLACLEAINGDVSYAVFFGEDLVFGEDAERPRAVGSAFKLGVLKVLLDDIHSGSRRFDHVVRLRNDQKSLPSGRLQAFPDGSPLTLHTLATLMVAESDNTATDVLIHLLSRGRIADALGLDSLLTTREFFALKADEDLASLYDTVEAARKTEIAAAAAARPLPGPSAVSRPLTPGVEWYIPNARLCALARAVRGSDVFSVNAGPVDRRDWQSVAFKGGSETGVLNLTAALSGKDGRDVAISVTINDKAAIDEAKAAGLFRRLARQLSGWPGPMKA